MSFNSSKYLAVGAKVRVKEPMDVPDYSVWDDDKGRSSTPVKRRLQSMFFRGDRKITAEVMYVARESDREKLRRKGLVKLRIREASGSMVNITADPLKLETSR
jgi:hypothetical protein